MINFILCEFLKEWGNCGGLFMSVIFKILFLLLKKLWVKKKIFILNDFVSFYDLVYFFN